jgi:hypothetical protein
MKYQHDERVRTILLWHGLLGFDSFNGAESAILKDSDWFKTWDTSDWHLDDLETVTVWRETHVANNAVATVSDTVLSRYFRIQSLNH